MGSLLDDRRLLESSLRTPSRTERLPFARMKARFFYGRMLIICSKTIGAISLFERMRRKSNSNDVFPSFLFVTVTGGVNNGAYRSIYFHIYYFSLFFQCSDNKSMR